MEYIFLEDCAADNCYEKNIGNGKQMCQKHQDMYDKGIPFKAFYGKTVLRNDITSLKTVYESFNCPVTSTVCCGIGPITNENFCPNCGKKIIR